MISTGKRQNAMQHGLKEKEKKDNKEIEKWLKPFTSLVCLCAFSCLTLARNAPNCSYDKRLLNEVKERDYEQSLITLQACC